MDVKMQQLKVTDNGFHQMCRLCLSGDLSKTDIFLFSSEFGKQIADIIMECVPVHITRHDRMPACICQLCFTQLKKFHQFQMQAVQSDRTLQRYLQPSRDCHPQINVESTLGEQSNNSVSRNYNAEPFENNDAINFVHSKSKVHENKFNEGIFFKSEIKDEPMDDDSLSPTECVDTLQILSKDGGSEDSVTAFDDTKAGVETPRNVECMTEKIFVKSEETYEYLPFKDGVEDNSNRSEHPGENQTFNFRKILLKKSAASTENKPHRCDICQMCFSKSSNLKRHTLIHTGEKPYQCEICQMLFREARNLKIHNLIHTGEKPFQCEICKMCFRTAHTLKKHNLIHTGEKPYQCDVCQMCFRHTISLKNHKLEHTGEKQPGKHQKCRGLKKSAGKKTYQCGVCQMRFTKSSNLKRHNLIHTGEKPYQCDICKLCFNESGNLKKHILIHTGEKPYQCEICKKCFRQSQTLKKHNLLHTGERPYKCSICKKCYRRSTSLKKHSLVHTEDNP